MIHECLFVLLLLYLYLLLAASAAIHDFLFILTMNMKANVQLCNIYVLIFSLYLFMALQKRHITEASSHHSAPN